MNKYYLILLMLIVPMFLDAQESDFGIWYNIGASHKLNDQWKLNFDASVRTYDQASEFRTIFLEGGITYKFNKYLSASGYYRLIEKLENDDKYHLRHRVYADLKAQLPVDRFKFDARLRFQRQYRTYIDDEDDEGIDYYGRLKFSASYNIPKFPVDPFVSFEMFCPVFNEPEKTIDRNRTSLGLAYKISKKQKAEVEYIYQHNYLTKITNFHLLSLNYSFEF